MNRPKTHKWEWINDRNCQCVRCGKYDQPYHKREKQTPCPGKINFINLPTFSDYYPEVIEQDLVLDQLNEHIKKLETKLQTAKKALDKCKMYCGHHDAEQGCRNIIAEAKAALKEIE